jgi:hypothetical protein
VQTGDSCLGGIVGLPLIVLPSLVRSIGSWVATSEDAILAILAILWALFG